LTQTESLGRALVSAAASFPSAGNDTMPAPSSHTPQRTFRLDDDIMRDLARIADYYRVNQTAALKLALRDLASRVPVPEPRIPIPARPMNNRPRLRARKSK
jgi:hypothetical protein